MGVVLVVVAALAGVFIAADVIVAEYRRRRALRGYFVRR